MTNEELADKIQELDAAMAICTDAEAEYAMQKQLGHLVAEHSLRVCAALRRS